MGPSDYPWQIAVEQLLSLHPQIWPGPHHNMSLGQRTADFFGMRALRRVVALDALFERGLYVESHALVRTGYEDWITFSYSLGGGEPRLQDLWADVNKVDARVYDAFRRLCSNEQADKYFKDVPAVVLRYVGKPRSRTKPLGGVTMAARASDVGLGAVHEYVYEWLSARTHPGTRTHSALFERMPDQRGFRVRGLERDHAQETRLALWAWWFELRTLTLAAAEYGIDVEPLSDELLALRDLPGLYTCVLVRESVDRHRAD